MGQTDTWQHCPRCGLIWRTQPTQHKADYLKTWRSIGQRFIDWIVGTRSADDELVETWLIGAIHTRRSFAARDDSVSNRLEASEPHDVTD